MEYWTSVKDFLKENVSVVQSVVGLMTIILSFFTFKLARRVKLEFLNNQTLTKQIEVLNNLIKELNESKIVLERWHFNKDGAFGTGWAINYNIFEIGDLLISKDTYNGESFSMIEADDFEVLFRGNSNQIWDLKNYIDNPFLPIKIADELMNFYSSSLTVITRENLGKNNDESIILQSGVFEKDKMKNIEFKHSDYLQGNAIALLSWLNLKTHSFNLKLTIIKWFKAHGISEVNLRVDFKN